MNEMMDDEQLLSFKSISSTIYDRIVSARASPIHLGSAYLFICPVLGRNCSSSLLIRVAQDIGLPADYQVSQPLLVVSMPDGDLGNKLVVLGGGHRLLIATRVFHLLAIPYQLVDLSNIPGLTGEVLLQYGAIITYHVEVSKPRPNQYGIMEQVALYGELRELWTRLEAKRVDTEGRRTRPKALTQSKVTALYNALKAPTGKRARYAISFLDVSGKHTRKDYICGADRLLQSGVIEDLCLLESLGYNRFSISSLNIVRSWSVSKIHKTVKAWMSRRRNGDFSVLRIERSRTQQPKKRKAVHVSESKIGSKGAPGHEEKIHHPEVNVEEKSSVADPAQGSNPSLEKPILTELEALGKPAVELVAYASPEGEFRNVEQPCNKLPSSSKRQKTVPPEWKSYFKDDFVPTSEALELVEKQIEKEISADCMSVVPDSVGSRLEVVRLLKHDVASGAHHSALDFMQIVREKTETVRLQKSCTTLEEVEGGFLQNKLTLNSKDVDTIVKGSMATDQSLLFTISVLNSWTPKAINTLHIADPILTSGWWDERLDSKSTRLKALREGVISSQGFRRRCHDLLWNSRLSLLYLSGKGHWSIAVLSNLSLLRDILGGYKQRLSAPAVRKQAKAAITILDSKGESSSGHKDLYGNIVFYLSSCLFKMTVSFEYLKKILIRRNCGLVVQEDLEFGFYVSYHTQFISKNIALIRDGGTKEILRHLKQAYINTPFGEYHLTLQRRLRSLTAAYQRNLGVVVRCAVLLDDELEKIISNDGHGNGDEEQGSETTASKLNPDIELSSICFRRVAEEGEKLLEDVADQQLRKEWEECTSRVAALVRKMKASSSPSKKSCEKTTTTFAS